MPHVKYRGIGYWGTQARAEWIGVFLLFPRTFIRHIEKQLDPLQELSEYSGPATVAFLGRRNIFSTVGFS